MKKSMWTSIAQTMVRLLVHICVGLIYRIRVVGEENVPFNGPALLVPNHVSMVDPFLITCALKRVPRFLMWRFYYEKVFIGPVVKLMGAIPISDLDPPKEIMRSLQRARTSLDEGHLVALFAEGQISRLGGETLGFQRGVDVIIKNKDVAVIPVHLEGVWGSIFSFEGKKFIWKWPRKLPYPVTITFGKPLKNPTMEEIRQAVMELGSDAFKTHRKKEPALFRAFLKQAKRYPFQKIVADSSGKELNYIKVLAGSTLLAKKLGAITNESNIGILIPPSVGGTLSNLAVKGMGLVPINLNYTMPREEILKLCDMSQVKRIVTARKVIKKLDWAHDDRFVYVEDILLQVSQFEKLTMFLFLLVTPRKILEATLFKRGMNQLEDLSTIIFTSGSTAEAKGVMLTEGNILSNIQSIEMIMQITKNDVILGVLPFFHSFGFTTSLWFPLLAGFKAVFHTNPLETKIIGSLCKKHKVTLFLGTPTFLAQYMRKINKEDFSSLRMVVAGAEKLRPEFAQKFEEKYNVPVMEGYGCTELSPVVAFNLPNVIDGELIQVGRKVGKVGRAIPGVSIKIVDPKTFAPVPTNSAGLLLVKGPNVMKGYWNDPELTATVMRYGYYITGDIATVDDDGFIEITDRLSRFSKIGGEMVPHIKIEEKLHEMIGATDRTFVVSGVPDIKKGESLVVLVCGYNGSIDELCKKLHESDLPNLWIPEKSNFILVDSIPILGSGKLDMRKIKELIKNKIQN